MVIFPVFTAQHHRLTRLLRHHIRNQVHHIAQQGEPHSDFFLCVALDGYALFSAFLHCCSTPRLCQLAYHLTYYFDFP
jgi:hypothetical protein